MKPREDAPSGRGHGDAVVLRVRGRVQGVGFRPHVARVAREQGLRGSVRNDAEGVTIAVAGDLATGARLRDRLLAELPALARVDAVEMRIERIAIADGFLILESRGGAPRAEIAPDAALCDACRAEILDPRERRYRYPFASCACCGPRYSIVTAIPYDRARTTMAAFPMCGACRAEHDDAGDRRYHAQPIACPVCGPKAWLEGPSGGALAAERGASL